MPEATTYISDFTSKQARDIESAFAVELSKRQRTYKAAWDYYYGEHKRHLVPDDSNTDDNLIVNLIELLIDKGVSSLMGTTEQGAVKGPVFEVIGDDPAEQGNVVRRAAREVRRRVAPLQKTEQQIYLDQIWEANSKALLLHDLAVNGGICGHVFLKVVPEGIVSLEDPDVRLPRLIALNPANIAVFWDESDTQRVLWYRIQYGAEGNRQRQDIVRSEAINKDDPGYWIIYNYEQTNNNRKWHLSETPIQWEHAWSPIVEWKNMPHPNEHYGRNDIGKSGNLNDGLNFTASNIQRIIKHHAGPKTIGTGINPGEMDETAINSFWTTPNADAHIYNLEMQSDLSSSLNFMQWIRRAFFDSGREIDPSTVQDKLGAMTNFGLRVLYRDSLEKVGTKRLLYGAGLRETCRHLLELGGYAATLRVVDKWPDPLPTDQLQTAQALEIDRRHGLSMDSYLDRRGYDAQEEAKQRENDIAEGVLGATLGRQGALVDNLRNGSNGNGR